MGATASELSVGDEVYAQDNSVSTHAGKYLTFVLENETYGIEILKIREIICLIDITEIPQSPAYLKGIVNLRGKVIPVLDLRVKFLMDETVYTKETCIIVVEVNDTHIGLIVDAVSEVIDIKNEEIEKTTDIGNSAASSFMLGLGKVDDKIIILLDIDMILNADEFAAISNL